MRGKGLVQVVEVWVVGSSWVLGLTWIAGHSVCGGDLGQECFW